MKKRLFSALIAFAMIFVLVPTIYAAETAADYSWYDTTSQSFTLNDAGDLLGFSAIVSGTATDIAQDSFDGKTVTLGASVDMAGVTWTPVGGLNGEYSFDGTFDGNGKTVSNLTVSTEATYMGLFAKCNGATVKNLTLDKVTLSTAQEQSAAIYMGAVSAYATDTTVQDITVNTLTATTTSTDASMIGGVIGYNISETVATVKNITVNGFKATINKAGTKVTALNGVAGAVFQNVKGTTVGTLNIENFKLTNFEATVAYDGNPAKNSYTAGLVGYSTAAINAKGCEISGAISGNSDKSAVKAIFSGGFVGAMDSDYTFEDCSATLNLSVTNAVAGGFMGFVNETNNTAKVQTLNNCDYTGAISSGRIIGGIIGQFYYFSYTVAVVNCEINAELTSVDSGATNDTADALIGYLAPTKNAKTSLSLYGTSLNIVINKASVNDSKGQPLFSYDARREARLCMSGEGYYDMSGNAMTEDIYNVAANRAQTKYSEADGMDIRLVSAVDEATVQSGDKLGFVVFLTYKDAEGNTVVKSVSGETDTVYTSVKADGLDVSAETLGGKYLYVAEIQGYKSATKTEAATDITIDVIPYLVKDNAVAYDKISRFTFDYNGDAA
ncbi:MAG: hypothetical protein IJY08_04375 [Clostridia bacterium]|nr:hypothetical protein [Clostridia bacterium]